MSSLDAEVIPPALAERPLLDGNELGDLSGLFRVLANDTRLRILHVISRTEECSVSEIATQIAASTQTVSNHLQRMADQRIVASRRDGNRIYYRLVDPCVGGVMELGLCLLGHGPSC
ncbi:MAG: ArsR/SmtB family transcription factor [Acidimicrobiales bacterium]